jgi:hypothetical protein
MDSVTSVTVRSWSEFLELVESPDLHGWAFRGQRDAAWPLVSSLTRTLRRFVDPALWATQEDRAIRVFRRKAHHFLADPTALTEGFRCLALMQHHGAPTRLLDFTKSPYVAAHFALESATSDAAVFAVNSPALWIDATPRERPELDRESIDPRSGDNLLKYFLSNRYPIVWPGEPWTMDRRLVAQAGTFILPGRVDQTIEELLEQYQHPEPLLMKIVLPAHLRSQGMQALYRMNITNATLFPDLEGLARSIAYELEVNWIGSSGPPVR